MNIRRAYEGDTRHLTKYCDLTWNAAQPGPGGGGGHTLPLLLLVARQLEEQAQDRLGGGHRVITRSHSQSEAGILIIDQSEAGILIIDQSEAGMLTIDQ